MAQMPTFDPQAERAPAFGGRWPDGWYAVDLHPKGMTPTADAKQGKNDHHFLLVECHPSEEHHPNLTGYVSARFNLRNSNPKAVAIATRELGEMSDACGITEPFDDDEVLAGRIIAIRVGVGRDPNFNEIKAFDSLVARDAQLMPADVVVLERVDTPKPARPATAAGGGAAVTSGDSDGFSWDD